MPEERSLPSSDIHNNINVNFNTVDNDDDLNETKVIPIYCDNDNDETKFKEWMMIEINGELLGPMEYPDENTSRTILGNDGRQVELGKITLSGNENDKVCGILWLL